MEVTVKTRNTASDHRKRSSKLLSLFLAAAILLFVFIALFCMHRPSQTPEHQIGQTICWNTDVGDIRPLAKVFVSYDLEKTKAMAFSYGIVVEAKITRILPDTYTHATEILGGDRWHILQMQTLDVVAGKNMPREFYLMLPATYSTELSRFDSFLITLTQKGFEAYTLINTDQCRYERFSPIFVPVTLDPDHSEINGAIASPSVTFSILAFRNGLLDTSLWDEDMWNALPSAEHLLAPGSDYPVKKGSTLSGAKLSILASRWQNRKYITDRSRTYHTLENQPTGEMADYLNTHAFAQNFYQPNGHPLGVKYRRIVNGFLTNECHLRTQDGTDTESEIVFTDADIAALPDLVSVLQQTIGTKPEGSTDTTCIAEVRAGYHKSDDRLFGYIRIVWGDRNKEVAAKNLIIYPDGTMQELSLEEWKLYRTNK